MLDASYVWLERAKWILLLQREFPRFVETYHELRAEGLPFSEQYQSDRPPVLDPGSGSLLDRSAAEKAQGEQSGAQPTAAAEASAVRAGSEDGKLEQGGEKDGSTGAPKLEALSGIKKEKKRRAFISDFFFSLFPHFENMGETTILVRRRYPRRF